MKRIRRRRTLAILLTLTLFAGAAYTLGWSSVFSVKRVIVLGAPTSSESDAIRSSINLGEKLARIEPRNLNSTLKDFAWLKASTVSRNWMKGIVTIRVFTRIPVARRSGSLIDETGHIFTLPGKQKLALPVIQANSTSALTFAVDLLNLLPPEIRQTLISIEASGPRSARLKIHKVIFGKSRNLTILWGDLSNSDLKSRVYQALLALSENSKVQVVDVSAPHAPIVR